MSSLGQNLDSPDYVSFDFDLGKGRRFSAAVAGPRAPRAKLSELGLEFFLKTSGVTGLCFYLPSAEGQTNTSETSAAVLRTHF